MFKIDFERQETKNLDINAKYSSIAEAKTALYRVGFSMHEVEMFGFIPTTPLPRELQMDMRFFTSLAKDRNVKTSV